MTGAYGSPFLTAPDRVASDALVSGGGADGYIDHVVAFCLPRVRVDPAYPVSADVPAPGARVFDIAELVAWACNAAGVVPVPPARTDLLRAHCYRYGTTLPSVALGLDLKGALLFGVGVVGLSLGVRQRVIVSDHRAGVVVDAHRIRQWTEAAVIPGARGYR